MGIEIINRQRLIRIDAEGVGQLARAALSLAGKPDSGVTIAFVRDRSIRDLNRRFRNVDSATDVLSFPGEDEGDLNNMKANGFANERFIGDIVISTDTAKRQARESGLSIERELSELVIHGVLHLCGYDHENDDGQMNRLELRIRKKLLD